METNQAAADVYEIQLIETAGPRSWFRTLVVLAKGLFSSIDGSPTSVNPGGMIISVVNMDTGRELFRHIEDMADDHGELLHAIEADLATMTAEQFKTRWG